MPRQEAVALRGVCLEYILCSVSLLQIKKKPNKPIKQKKTKQTGLKSSSQQEGGSLSPPARQFHRCSEGCQDRIIPQTQTAPCAHPLPGEGEAGVKTCTFFGETILKNLLAPAAWLGREHGEVWPAAVRGKRWREQTQGAEHIEGETGGRQRGGETPASPRRRTRGSPARQRHEDFQPPPVWRRGLAAP